MNDIWKEKIISHKELFTNVNPQTRNIFETVIVTKIIKKSRYKTLTHILCETDDIFYEVLFTDKRFYVCSIEKEQARIRSHEEDVYACMLPLSRANYGSTDNQHPLYIALNSYFEDVKEYIEINE